MTVRFFDYPKRALYEKPLPNNVIFKNKNAGTTIKDLFTQQVKKIVWKYKLSPETTNVPSTDSLQELQILSIDLKEANLKHDVLLFIDKAIPSPLIFELHFEGKTKAVAAYKRPSEADSLKWVVSDYFETAWLSSDAPRVPLPMAPNLEKLYAHLLNQLMPFPSYPNEKLQTHVERMELIRVITRELEACEELLRKEKQFNRQVELNAVVRSLKQKIEGLICPLAGTKF